MQDELKTCTTCVHKLLGWQTEPCGSCIDASSDSGMQYSKWEPPTPMIDTAKLSLQDLKELEPAMGLQPIVKVPAPKAPVQQGTNPKDLIGEKKVPLWLVPASAKAHCAMAMKDGAKKYGPYNWRDNKVLAHVYIDAAQRHLDAYLDGEDYAKDSGVHHVAHAMACCAIILDALETQCLGDDRPKKGAAPEVHERFREKVDPAPKQV